MTKHPETTPSALERAISERILFMDGAMGTMIQRHGLEEEDYRGDLLADHPSDLKGNNDLLVLTRPDVIRGIHGEYFAAGADIVETNTFNANWISQEEYGTQAHVRAINLEAARIARKLAAQNAGSRGGERQTAAQRLAAEQQKQRQEKKKSKAEQREDLCELLGRGC